MPGQPPIPHERVPLTQEELKKWTEITAVLAFPETQHELSEAIARTSRPLNAFVIAAIMRRVAAMWRR